MRTFHKAITSTWASLSLAAAASHAEEILVGWHDFSSGRQVHRFLNSAKEADQSLLDVNGLLYGGNGSRDTWGSNDGSYGPTTPVGSTNVDGAMSLRTDRPLLSVSLTNNSTSSLSLSQIVFDFASVNGNSPQNLSLIYQSGDLNVSDGTQLASWTSLLNGLASVSDHEDIAVDLTTLSDRSLAPGEEATFHFVPDTATNNFQAMSIDNIAILGETFEELRVVTYNMHGGFGPNNEGTPLENLTSLRDNFLQDEDILCLQEVDLEEVWETVQEVFSDYPHRFQSINTTTRFSGLFSFLNRQTSVVILSKLPFLSTHEELVNIDPSIDRWERHGQHVQIEIGGEIVDIFNYHNTFDPEDGGTSSEVAGAENYRDYILSRVGPNALSQRGRLLALGDYNISAALLDSIMPNLVDRATDWVDHVASMSSFSSFGVYPTVAERISDHDGVWASLDLSSPTPSSLSWSILPQEAGTSSTTMTASPSSDPNGVEYLFQNLSFPDGSHDSGWQLGSSYIDTGLLPATDYTYTFSTRDRSPNQNQSSPSLPASTLTDDGDELPNDWELLHFSSLTTTTGSPSEDQDRDGLSDFAEYITGTNPIEPSSRFVAQIVQNETGEFELRWDTISERIYRVWVSENLGDDWSILNQTSPITFPENSIPLDRENAPHMFYKVEVSP